MTALQQNIKKILENKIFQIFEFLIITTVPVLIIYYRVVAFDHVGLVSVLCGTFVIVSILIFVRVYYTKSWTWAELGFTFTNIRKALPAYSMVFLAVCCCFVLAPYVTKTRNEFNVEYFFLYSVFGAVLQEILYRSYLMKLVKGIYKKKWFNLTLNILVFTGMHYVFPNFISWFGFIVLAGIIFAVLFDKYKYIVLISSLHIATNYFAFYILIF